MLVKTEEVSHNQRGRGPYDHKLRTKNEKHPFTSRTALKKLLKGHLYWKDYKAAQRATNRNLV